MFSSGNNLSRGNAGLSSDVPLLPQCLPLEPITLGNQKYTRSGELSRVLGVPLRSGTSEDHFFGVLHSKLSPPVATEELKNFKESVKDASRKASYSHFQRLDRVKKLGESISKLERYSEALGYKKKQQSDISSERTTGVKIAKMGSQIRRNAHEIMTQRTEDRRKDVGLNKRVRSSFSDLRTDNRTAVNPKKQGLIEKDSDVLSAVNGGSIRIEEKIRRLPGDGWETKMKRKRSVAAVGNRVANAGRDIKRAMQPKLSSESKSRSCDTLGSRSKSSPGVSGINRSDGSFEATGSDANTVLRNELESTSIPRDRAAMLEQRVVKTNNKTSIQDGNQANGLTTMLKAKGSRAPRTGSIMVLDSSSKVHLSSGALQGWEQPNLNKIQALGVASNKKRPMSTGSSSHAISQWGGQRPHKISRTRRANLVSPISNAEAPVSSQVIATPDFGVRASILTGGSLLGSSADNVTQKIKREPENASSPFGFSESEESRAGDSKSKEKGIDSCEVILPASRKAGPFLLPTRKNKNTNEIRDGVRRQGRNGSGAPPLTKQGVHPIREKLDDLRTTNLIQSARHASDKNRSKTGRPPSKKLKDRKAATRVGSMLNNASSDFTGGSDDDDHDELFAAATSARNASSLACSGPFWKKMGSIFSSVSSEDTSYLRQQLSLAEELDESLSQIFGDGFNVLGVGVQKDAPSSVEDSEKTNAANERFDIKKFDNVTPLYQRVLSALIEEDENDEHRIETKSMSLHYASDDSHCGSCNLMDVEFRDRDRMESEVESNADFQCQKNSLVDRLSGDVSVASNTFRNCSMSNSLHSSERWLGDDDFSHLDSLVSEICSTDLGQLQHKEINISDSPFGSQYHLMCMDDKLLLELNSIGLYPESLPDLAEGEEVINQNVVELNEHLYQQIQKKRKKLGKIDKAIENGRDVERRDIEHVAMDQLIEMAYRRRLACHRSNSSKSAVRKVSKQVALAFAKRTLGRCRNFEQTGSSCFSDPPLQDAMFSVPPCSNETKSADCIGSGTASNTCNETSNHQAEARGSGAVSSTFKRYDSSDSLLVIHSSEHAVSKYGSMLNKGRKREVLIDDVVGSASSKVTSTLDGNVGVNGKRSEREQSRNTKDDRKTEAKAKQKNNRLSDSGNGFNGRLTEPLLPTRPSSPGKINKNSTKETNESMDFELDTMEELGVPNELGGPQDLSSWLNFDDDGLQEQDDDLIGLEIPMDDLSGLKFSF